MATVKCSRCKINKELHTDYYSRNKSRKTGFSHRCKVCDREWQKTYRKTNPEQVYKSKRKSKLWKEYGLTETTWQDLHDKQGGKCFICRKSATRLHVDHVHAPGYKHLSPEEKNTHVRGLLCWRCNYFWMANGMSIEIAMMIVAYISNHEARQKKE